MYKTFFFAIGLFAVSLVLILSSGIDAYAVKDKFGVTELYPTCNSCQEWFNNWDNGHVVTFHNAVDPWDPMLRSTGSGSFTINGNGTGTESGQKPRLYINGSLSNHATYWNNTEMTFYFRLDTQSANASSSDGFKIGSKSGSHDTAHYPNEQTDCCNNTDSAYNFNLLNDGRGRFLKEILFGIGDAVSDCGGLCPNSIPAWQNFTLPIVSMNDSTAGSGTPMYGGLHSTLVELVKPGSVLIGKSIDQIEVQLRLSDPATKMFAGNPTIEAENVTTNSVLVGKTINTLTYQVLKSGTPPGNYYVGVFDINQHTKRVFAVVQANSEITHYTSHTITFANYTVVAGDKIGIQYNDSGSTSANYLKVQRDTNNKFDGTNSTETNWNGVVWTTTPQIDMFMTLGQTHAPGTTYMNDNHVGSPTGNMFAGFFGANQFNTTTLANVTTTGTGLAVYNTQYAAIAEKLVNSSSNLVGQTGNTIYLYLKKTGSPTGLAYVGSMTNNEPNGTYYMNNINVGGFDAVYSDNPAAGELLRANSTINGHGIDTIRFMVKRVNPNTLLSGNATVGVYNFTNTNIALQVNDTTQSSGLSMFSGSRYAMAEHFNSTSAGIGKNFNNISLWIRKNGSPPAGSNYTFAVFKSDGTMRQFIGNGTATSLTTGFAQVTMSLGFNVTVSTDDYIGVSYNFGSAGNEVDADRDTGQHYDGTNADLFTRTGSSWTRVAGNDLTIQLKYVPPIPSTPTLLKQFGTFAASTIPTNTYQNMTFQINHGSPFTIGYNQRVALVYTGGNSTNYLALELDTGNNFDNNNSVESHYIANTGWVDTTSKDATGLVCFCATVPSEPTFTQIFGTLDTSTLTTGYTQYKFRMNSGNHTFKVGEYIGIKYPAGNSTYNLNVMRTGADVYDGHQSIQAQWDKIVPYGYVWDTFTAQDLKMAVTLEPIPAADPPLIQSFGILNVTNVTSNSYNNFQFGTVPANRTIQVGDRIGLQFLGGDAYNFVSVQRDLTNQFDGTNSINSWWNDGSNNLTWTDWPTIDMYMLLESGGNLTPISPSTGFHTIPKHLWIGMKGITRTFTNPPRVNLLMYEDVTNGTNGGHWWLVNNYTDSGGWNATNFYGNYSNSNWPYPGVAKDLVLSGAFPYAYFRTDHVGKADYWGASIREISLQPGQPPNPPELSGVGGNNNIALFWTPPFASNLAIQNYTIYNGTTSGGESKFKTIANVTNYTMLGLPNGITQYIKITATSNAGESGFSNEISVKPTALITPPTEPRLFTATPGKNLFSLSWIPPLDNGGQSIKKYYILRTSTDPLQMEPLPTNQAKDDFTLGHALNMTLNSLLYHFDDKSDTFFIDSSGNGVTGIGSDNYYVEDGNVYQPSLWHQAGTTISYNPVTTGDALQSNVRFTNALDGSDNRIYRTLTSPLPDSSWILYLEYAPDSETTAKHMILALTNNTNNPDTTSKMNIIGLNASDTGGGLNLKIFSSYNTLTRTNSGSSISTPLVLSTNPYYLTLQRTSSTNVNLNVYSDYQRTHQIAGSPISLTIDSHIIGLNNIQHSVQSSKSNTNRLDAFISNLKIFQTTPSNIGLYKIPMVINQGVVLDGRHDYINLTHNTLGVSNLNSWTINAWLQNYNKSNTFDLLSFKKTGSTDSSIRINDSAISVFTDSNTPVVQITNGSWSNTFYDDFYSTKGWLNYPNNIAGFTVVPKQHYMIKGSNNMYQQLPFTLDNSKWTFTTEYKLHPLNYINTPAAVMFSSSLTSPSVFAQANRIGVCDVSDNNPGLEICGGTSGLSTYTPIPYKYDTPYWIKLERLNPTTMKLSVFNDSSMRYQISGSPQVQTISAAITGLQYIWHGDTAQQFQFTSGNYQQYVAQDCLSNSGYNACQPNLYSVVRNGNTFTAYINGKQYGSPTTSNANLGVSINNQYIIGANSTGNGNLYSGKLDEYSIFNRALTQTEIQNMAYRGQGTYSVIGSTVGNSYTDSNLPNGGLYFYRTLASNGLYNGTWTEYQQGTTFSVPSKPLNLQAQRINSTNINLNWNTPTSDGGQPILGYYMQRQNGTDPLFYELPYNIHLKSYWKFDGNLNFTDYGKNKGNLTVQAGNNNNFVQGIVNQGFAFDGSTWFKAGNPNNYNYDFNTPFSLSGWFKTSSVTNQVIMAKGGTAGRDVDGWQWYIQSNGHPTFAMADPSGTKLLKVEALTNLINSHPQHITWVYNGNGSAKGVSMYLNGTLQSLLVDSNSLASNSIQNAKAVSIGSLDGGGSKFNGVLDDLRIYDGTLSQSFINQLVNFNIISGTSTSDNTVSSAQTFFYRVYAHNGIGASPFSNSASPVGAVTDLHTTVITNTSVGLAWSAPNVGNDTIIGYQINYTTPLGIPKTIIVNNTNSLTTSYTVSNLATQTLYSFRVGTWALTGLNPNGNIVDTNTTQAFQQINFTAGSLNITASNQNVLPIIFTRQDVNSSYAILNVQYPIGYNLTCNLNYQLAGVQRNYTNLPSQPFGNGELQSSFQFKNPNNDLINVMCTDSVTGNSARYVFTQQVGSIPMFQQIKDFQNGKYGTKAQFGIIDLVTLIVIIVAMIGLNRVNESVGVFFAIVFVGVMFYFGIIQFPTVFFSAVAVVAMVAIASTKKLPWS